MVAIKNLSIASAVLLSVADQGLAAPINTRSPKNGVKTSLAHSALSAAGNVGAAFAGAPRDLEDEDLVARALEELDERDVMDIYARYFDDAEDFEY
ncbi:unnamed protein product [Clonostachys rosea f. rosea IK726]|uniref:Uncharacterized protein n=2 Tax=Bionectria ochroleuca TaxID=29856 RepID=A0A0B7KKJ9_BIOOC|nr:unnamed protein product [Clonostachys rosea f. rosea IK726]